MLGDAPPPAVASVISDLQVLIYPTLLVIGATLMVVSRTPSRHPQAAVAAAARLREWLVQAGVPNLKPGHVVGLCSTLGAVMALLVISVSGSAWLGVAFGALSGYLPVLLLKARRKRRVRELQEVWPDAIDHLASGVRAGLSLPEAVATLASRGPELLRSAFARFADSYHATGRFAAALDQLKDELADPTADRVVEALLLVGGTQVGQTLRILAAVLRDHHRVRKELEARQSWAIVAARLAFATPWVVLLMLSTRREAVAAYRGPGGALVLAIGAAMAIIGYRMMLAIGRIPPEERILR
jgi:tight adherence protein B